ncbi:hypothetical protein D7B24_002760 [Verticillium nonalfalfae]|uniref:Uncharacterized protein n=1 Tax=Verticillium nonalfalfae TaxID=1051616 RepID=A0A3M9YHJ5_9PEZI|nr:uncharacterized protein D7B24_002760 [Verticillium nonalfalfae]RNJ59382.1 hypothetical protein D7B24_002760 [Verticillium nonalfalfae]
MKISVATLALVFGLAAAAPAPEANSASITEVLDALVARDVVQRRACSGASICQSGFCHYVFCPGMGGCFLQKTSERC